MSLWHVVPLFMVPAVRCNAPTRRPCPASPSSPCNPSSTDVTPPPPASSLASPPATPASTPPQFDDILEDPEYDRLSDRDELEEELLCVIGNPQAIRKRAMAADFSEGRLETLVDSPQKELAGTQNQYVSYQVTTKV